MKKNYLLTMLSLLFCFAIQAQVNYSGNGNSGFGDVFGSTGSLDINDDGTTITYTLNKGAGTFNDAIVIYIDSKTGGFSDTSTFDDTGDELRKAVSGFDGTNRAQINFPAGFTADYAIAINVNLVNFGGLWELASTGSHTFVQSVNVSPEDNTSSATYTFDTDFTEIGTTPSSNFKFVATLLNQGNAFRSDEAIGDGISSGNPGNPSTVTFSDDRSYPNTWTGTTDTDWATATNWTEGVPSATHNVYIPDVTNQPTAAAAVTINKGIIKSGASLIAQSTFAGSMTYERNIPTTNWYLVSAPVSGQDIDTFVAASNLATGTQANNVGFSDYDNTSESWTYYQSTATGTGNFNVGQGHAVKLSALGSVSFTGSFNDDNVSTSLTINTNGFNLIGNPYTSYISVSELIEEDNVATGNEALLSEQTIWLWDQSANAGAGGYVQKNLAADLEIAPGQGFFVLAGSTGTFDITEAMQSHSADTFLTPSSNRPEINLTLTNESETRAADIYYIDGTTTGFDNGYDSSIFGGFENEFAIYTHEVTTDSGRNLGIQSLPDNDYENMIIPVGINATSGMTINISASSVNLPAGIKLYLQDTSDNSFTLLENGSKFTTTLTSDLNGSGRFYLYTALDTLGVDSATLNDMIGIYTPTPEQLRIVGVQSGAASVVLYNMIGKQVLKTAFQGQGANNITLPTLASGVYVIQLTTESGIINRKIILN